MPPRRFPYNGIKATSKKGARHHEKEEKTHTPPASPRTGGISPLVRLPHVPPHSRTLPAADSGIILSITTYDGDGESTPLVKCFGHTWLSIDNRSGSPVYIKDYELRHGEQLTFSVWAVTRLPGLLFNLEPTYISAHDRYAGRRSLSVPIESTRLKTLEEYMDRRNGWTLGKNCSYWSVQLWNALVDDAYKLKTQTLFYTPKRLERAFLEFDRVEVDKDFSRAGHIFAYRRGVRTELQLCP